MTNSGIFLLMNKGDRVFSSKEVSVSDCFITVLGAVGWRQGCVFVCVYYTYIQEIFDIFRWEFVKNVR